jgi:hypothetical protein
VAGFLGSVVRPVASVGSFLRSCAGRSAVAGRCCGPVAGRPVGPVGSPSHGLNVRPSAAGCGAPWGSGRLSVWRAVVRLCVGRLAVAGCSGAAGRLWGCVRAVQRSPVGSLNGWLVVGFRGFGVAVGMREPRAVGSCGGLPGVFGCLAKHPYRSFHADKLSRHCSWAIVRLFH